MTESPRISGTGPDREPTGVPRWLKLAGISLLILLLLVIAVMLISGGEHGPSRHAATFS